jgi:hypothetical protein
MIKNIIIGTLSFFLVVTGFYFLIPAWSSASNGIIGVDNQIITNPTYLANIQQESIYLNSIVGLSFIAMAIGVWIWMLLSSTRRQSVQDALGNYEEVA